MQTTIHNCVTTEHGSKSINDKTTEHNVTAEHKDKITEHMSLPPNIKSKLLNSMSLPPSIKTKLLNIMSLRRT